jgi:hypothetical protein
MLFSPFGDGLFFPADAELMASTDSPADFCDSSQYLRNSGVDLFRNVGLLVAQAAPLLNRPGGDDERPPLHFAVPLPDGKNVGRVGEH